MCPTALLRVPVASANPSSPPAARYACFRPPQVLGAEGRRRATAGILLLAGLGVGGCSTSRGTSQPLVRRSAAVRVQDAPPGIPSGTVVVGIPNFHVVHPFLVRGGAPTPEGLAHLKRLGVRTVIDLRIAPKRVRAERQLVEGLGMRSINLPMSSEAPTPHELQTFVKTVRDPASQPVFLHCEHGADRTGCLVGVYRVRYDGWSFDRAYREMRRYGFTPAYHKLTATVRRFAPQ
jgi:tyrosine-protein phosphatase SIW14